MTALTHLSFLAMAVGCQSPGFRNRSRSRGLLAGDKAEEAFPGVPTKRRLRMRSSLRQHRRGNNGESFRGSPGGAAGRIPVSWLPPDATPTVTPDDLEVPRAPLAGGTRVPLRQNWDRRTRFETLESGLFVGREELLERLTGDFTARSSGTVLISGVRGVGKTALVDRALLRARVKLQDRYWRLLVSELLAGRFWTLDFWVRRTLSRAMRTASYTGVADLADYSGAARAAAATATRQTWFQRLKPIDRLIRRLYEASGSQLLVLKFDASDISGALAEPEPLPDPKQPAGKPQVNPEKLMRALIRKLYSTCHPSQRTVEARVLGWSLDGTRQRREFFDRLAAAYQKSVSKSYKETISDSLKEALKESQSSGWELKANMARIFGAAVFLAFLGFAIWAGIANTGWQVTQKYLMSGSAGVAAFVSLGWTLKRTRERKARLTGSRHTPMSSTIHWRRCRPI